MMNFSVPFFSILLLFSGFALVDIFTLFSSTEYKKRDRAIIKLITTTMLFVGLLLVGLLNRVS